MLRVVLKPSRCLAVAFAAVHVAAAGTLLPVELPFSAKAAVATLIAVSLARAAWRYAFLKGRDAAVALELREKDGAAVLTRDGRWHEARVLATTYVSPL